MAGNQTTVLAHQRRRRPAPLLDARGYRSDLSVGVRPRVARIRDQPIDRPPLDLVERALVAALAEMYVQGVSTRKVKAITEELCGHSFSASSISAINQRLDDGLAQFADRRLVEAFPVVGVRQAPDAVGHDILELDIPEP